MVHLNILVTCVFAAFLGGALLAGLLVFCYRDSFLRKPGRAREDAETAPPGSASPGSFVKLTGLFDSPVKVRRGAQVGPAGRRSLSNLSTPQEYQTRLDADSPGDTRTAILRDGRQPPELAAPPTPESTPVLQQRSRQWDRGPQAGGPLQEPAKSPKSPPFPPSAGAPAHPHLAPGHALIPSAVVLPNATHDHADLDGGEDAPPHAADRKPRSPAPEGGRREQKRSVDARNTLNDLLKHLNDSVANPQEGAGPRQHLALGPVAEAPPRVPSREASLYSPSSSLPRHSPTKRVDVPLATPPTGSTGGTLERGGGGPPLQRSASHRHSLSSGGATGASPSRQHSMNRGGYPPPTPPSRLDSQGGGMHPAPPPDPRGYRGYGSLPRTGLRRTPSLRPDVPPKPLPPQTAQIRVVNKFSY